jgi:endo-1,4-beta-xylanase
MRARRIGSLIAALVVAAFPATAFAATSDPIPSVITDSKSGTHDGFYYMFWKDFGDTTFTMWSQGRYTSSFSAPNGNAFGGKGWNPGGPRVVQFSGTFNPSAVSYLALYGWTKGPLTEYYIVENHGAWVPPGSRVSLGTVTTDGGVYDIYNEQVRLPISAVHSPSTGATQVSPYSIYDSSFTRYWSVRRVGRNSGVITTANHFEAWAKYGFTVGSQDYQILSTEAYHGSVSSDMTVSLAGCSLASPSEDTGTVSPTNICAGSTPTSTTPKTRTPKVVTSTTVTKCRTAKKGAITCKVVTKKTRIPAPVEG